jgi:lipopolysaccharide transport system ATP-binding protein
MSDAEILIEVDGLWKKYARTTGESIKYGVRDALAAALGKQDGSRLRNGEFWSLRDVSLTVRRGETLGVCGHNGAGKTTLLKALGGLLRPDRGTVSISGQVAWLVDIGAGLNPKLTGWENTVLRAEMSGVKTGGSKVKESLRRELDEFTELGEFLDAPVGHYSSGMKAKVGFAIATMTRPDVLIIDETLAVGDLSFRMKCYDRISEISRDAAVLFVSHGMNHVARICSKGCYLEAGKVLQHGDINETIRLYNDAMSKGAKKSSGFNPDQLEISALNDDEGTHAEINERNDIRIRFRNGVSEFPSNVQAIMRDASGTAVALSSETTCSAPGSYEITVKDILLRPGNYELSLTSRTPDGRHLAISDGRHLSIKGHQGQTIAYCPRADIIRLDEPKKTKEDR